MHPINRPAYIFLSQRFLVLLTINDIVHQMRRFPMSRKGRCSIRALFLCFPLPCHLTLDAADHTSLLSTTSISPLISTLMLSPVVSPFRQSRANRKTSTPFLPGAWPSSSGSEEPNSFREDVVSPRNDAYSSHGFDLVEKSSTTLPHLDHVMKFHRRISDSLSANGQQLAGGFQDTESPRFKAESVSIFRLRYVLSSLIKYVCRSCSGPATAQSVRPELNA